MQQQKYISQRFRWENAVLLENYMGWFQFSEILEQAKLIYCAQNTKIMASGPITSWQIDGERVETVADFVLGGSKITAGGDCSHEIKRCLLLGRKVITNLDSILKSRDTMVEFEWTLGVSDGQGGLACCDSWGHKELTRPSDWTELNWTGYSPYSASLAWTLFPLGVVNSWSRILEKRSIKQWI